MARRILFVETTSVFRDPEKELFVDAWVEIDWKIRMAIDEWNGDIQTARPTYKVRPLEQYPSEMNEYGVISDPEHIAWLAKAMTMPLHNKSYEAISLIACINEIGIKNLQGRQGFNIEVLTGIDAKNLIMSEKRVAVMAFMRKYWWPIGLGLFLLWWWFIGRQG